MINELIISLIIVDSLMSIICKNIEIESSNKSGYVWSDLISKKRISAKIIWLEHEIFSQFFVIVLKTPEL